MKLVALVVASLVGLSGIAAADTPYDGPPGAEEQVGTTADYRPVQRQRPLRQAVVAQFDRDHDGKLSPKERRHAARALRKMARKMARQQRRAERQQRGPQPRVDVDVNW
jgi:hypothetical protein